MPAGVLAGAGPEFGTVGPNNAAAFVSAGDISAVAVSLAAECLTEEIFQTAIAAATSNKIRMIVRLLFTSSPFVNHLTANNGSYGAPGEVPAVERRVLRFRQ